MKKVISVLFLAAMLISLLASCGNIADTDKPDGDKEDEPKVGFDISGYTIVRPDGSGASVKEFTATFKKMILDYTDSSLSVITDSTEDSGKEILLGQTNRKESIDAYEKLEKDNSYAIKVVKNKIVIVGKTEEATIRAMKKFLDDHAKTSEGKNTLNLDNDYSKTGMVDLDSIVFDNFAELEIESKTSVIRPDKWTKGIIQYTSIVPLSDGTLLATYENYGYCYNIHRSTDDGKTWEQISKVKDTLNTDYIAEWMPCLYELPVDMGEYKAGTVILAGTSKNDKDNFDESKITLHASTDKGETWKTICNVDEAGGIIDDLGVWEPFLIYEAKRGRLYCFYSDDSDPRYSQKLSYKYTTDLVNWHGKDDKVGVDVDPKDAVACSDSKLRPGMISIADMGEGGYIMTYEMVGLPHLQTHCKKTMDLDDWGDISDYGDPVVSIDAHSFGSSSWCAWTPEGGECGTLVVVGKHPSPYYHTKEGTKMLLSFDYGETFVAINNPIPYNVDKCGYSPCVIFSKDGKTLYYTNNPLFGFEFCQEVVLAKIKIR